MAVFENIAKSLYVAGQLPLDAKTYFPTITEMQNLGVSDYKTFTYYEYMLVMCVETAQQYVWKEVDQSYTGGILTSNFLYPADTISDNIDYSNRYFNFVPYTVGSPGSEPIAKPYIIYKHPNNSGDYLEVGDVVEGFWSTTEFGKRVYKGGAITLATSWANIDKINPGSYPQNT